MQHWTNAQLLGGILLNTTPECRYGMHKLCKKMYAKQDETYTHIATAIISQFQILDMLMKSMVVKDIMAGFADGVKGIGSAFGAGIGSLFKR